MANNKNLLLMACSLFDSNGKYSNVISECINNGYNVNERNIFDGETPLIKLIRKTYERNERFAMGHIENMINHGADVNIVDYDGKNALSYSKIVSITEYLKKNSSSSNDEAKSELKSNFKNCNKVTTVSQEDVNSFDDYGFTPLMWSIWYQDIELFNYYISAGADVNLKNPDGKTPLMIACYKLNIDIIKQLLNKGANVNSLDNFGNSMLVYFTHSSHFSKDKLTYLLDNARANINLCGRNGKTPFIWFVINSRLNDLLHFWPHHKLRKLENVVNYCDNEGNTVLGYLSFLGNLHGISKFFNSFNYIIVDHCGKKGRTPLAWAITNDHWDVFLLLIEKNAKINHIDFHGNTPLTYARRYGRTSMIDYLLKNGGIDPHQHPLTVAMQSNHLENFRALLKDDLNCFITELETTPLCLAVKENNLDFIKILIQNGSSCCQKDKKGNSPLIYAIHFKNIEVIKYLLENGGKSTIHSAFNTALETENVEIIKLLIENGAKVNKIYGEAGSPLLQAINMENEEVFKLLLASGATPNPNENPSLLINAINLKQFTFVKLLIENGTNVDEDLDSDEKSPLQRACALEEFELIELLVENNASINSNKFPSPLRIVTLLNNLKIVKYLIGNGANVCEIHNDEKSLLQLAIEKRNIELVKVLIEKDSGILKITNKFSSPLRTAIEINNVLLIRYFIEQGADVNESDDSKGSLLQLAIKRGDFALVVSLLEHGADIESNRNALEEFSKEDMDFEEFFNDFTAKCNVDDETQHANNSNKEEYEETK